MRRHPAAARFPAVRGRSLSSAFLLNMGIVILLSVPAMGALWVRSLILQYRADSVRERAEYLASQEALLKGEVDKAVDYIEYEKSRVEERVKKDLIERTGEAYAIADNLWRRHGVSMGAEGVRRLVKDSLRPIRYQGGSGYYFATGLDGTEELFADRPELEGQDLLGMRDTQGRYVIRDMIDIVKAQGEGFYAYTWTKPGAEGKGFRKIAHIRLFEPFGWLLGTGEYVDDVEADIQKEVIARIERIRFGRDGYVFVGTWDGVSLAEPEKGKNKWDITDPNGVKIVQELVKAARRGGGFVRYVMPAFEGKRNVPKLSYARGVPDWGWYVGAGTYIDEIDAALAERGAVLRAAVRSQALWILAVLAVLIAFTAAAARLLFVRVRGGLAVFRRFFERAAGDAEPIEAGALPFREFAQLAEPANRMVADRRRAEREKAALEDQLRHSQKMEAMGRLAGGVAHDFNNLLTVIRGYNDITLESLPASDPSRGDLAEIGKAADRAADLTRRLLAFSRKQDMEMRPVHLEAVLRDLEGMLRRLIGEDIEFVLKLDPAAGPIFADPAQIGQAVVNLAVNAKDAMPGGGSLVIETAETDVEDGPTGRRMGLAPGRYVTIRVSDTGVGMGAEVKAHLFEPFFTTKGKGKGTGLGLSTVYGIVKQSGGHIEADSEEGRGTTFRIYLPRSQQVPAEEESAEPAAGGGEETILVVEDEKALRDLAVRILSAKGYRILSASCGADALQASAGHEGRIHMVVTDVVMPGMGGRELSERWDALRPGTRFLFMSGYTDDAVLRGGILEDRVAFIQKPFTAASLARKVRETLDS